MVQTFQQLVQLVELIDVIIKINGRIFGCRLNINLNDIASLFGGVDSVLATITSVVNHRAKYPTARMSTG